MVNTYTYPTEKDVVRLVQITDPHLFKDENGELLGINTQASFNQVLREITQSPFDYELVLATGDLVQDSSNEGYQRFCESVQCLEKTVFGYREITIFSQKCLIFLIKTMAILTR